MPVIYLVNQVFPTVIRMPFKWSSLTCNFFISIKPYSHVIIMLYRSRSRPCRGWISKAKSLNWWVVDYILLTTKLIFHYSPAQYFLSQATRLDIKKYRLDIKKYRQFQIKTLCQIHCYIANNRTTLFQYLDRTSHLVQWYFLSRLQHCSYSV